MAIPHTALAQRRAAKISKQAHSLEDHYTGHVGFR